MSMDNSNSVEGTMETVDTVIFWAISEIRANQNVQMKPEFIILLKAFLTIVAYPMAPFGKEWKHWGPMSYYK